MNEEQSSILCQKSGISIEQCSCCGNIVFYYNNLLLKFTPQGFMKFGESFRQLNFEQRSRTFGVGTKKLIVNTTQKEVQLCFTKSEFNQVCEAFEEAAVMLEVNQILYD